MVEHNIQLARDLDVYRAQLGEFAAENNKLLSAANAQSKVDMSRKMNYQQICNNERLYEEKLQEQERQRVESQRRQEQNQNLAIMLDRETAEMERKMREIQRICADSPELKDLEKALKIAYLNKERATQHMEKVLRENIEKERVQAMEDKLEHERQMADKAEKAKRGKADDAFAKDRVILQRQIKEREDTLLEAKNQMMIDRANVDEIVRKIQDEDRQAYQKKRDAQEETARTVRMYEEQGRKAKADRAAALQAEEDAIAAYNKAVEDRGAGVEAKKAAKEEEKMRALAKIVAETERKRKEEEEFSNLRDMLWEEELEAQRSADTQARKDKAHAIQKEMMEANQRMMDTKAQIRHQAAQDEARMLALMRKKFAADEDAEREKDRKKKAEKAHHMTLIHQQSAERKVMFDREKAQEEALLEEGKRKEEYRQMVIKEARRKLLEQHAANLAGYMPGGILKNKDDIEVYQQTMSNLGLHEH